MPGAGRIILVIGGQKSSVISAPCSSAKILADPTRGVAGWKRLTRSLVHDVRAGNRPSQLLLNRVHQVFKRVRPLMLDAVDEECRCAVHITTSPTLDVALHA